MESLSANLVSRQLISAIEKAIRDDATLNLNPVVTPDSTGGPSVIKVPIPRSTAEVKQQMTKTANTMTEKVKASIRSTRQAARDALKKKFKDVYSDDEVKKIEKEVGASSWGLNRVGRC